MKLVLSGPQQVNGTVTVDGAKNSATRVLAAALLSDEKVSLRNFPLLLEDVKVKMNFISELGAVVQPDYDKSELHISVSDITLNAVTSYDLPIRTTYLLAAAQIARNGLARIPYPGGCKIGNRGYDLHIDVWKALGCSVTEEEQYIEVKGNFKGGQINFPISTVGGTENALMCASVADGSTVIRNAYITPEVEDLISFLREMGAQIQVSGSSHIQVEGANGALGGASFSIMPDRIEALTWVILASITGGNLWIRNVPFDMMEVPLLHLRHAGIDYLRNSDSLVMSSGCIDDSGIQPFELACGTHPGVISDMQSFFVLLGLFANGRSRVFDYRYPERTKYALELSKMFPGAVDAKHGQITVDGGNRPRGAVVRSTDLRGSMALVMAALTAEGDSVVEDVELALRGYNNLPEKLTQLGVEAEWSC